MQNTKMDQTSSNDLAWFTRFVHIHRPDLSDRLVLGIEVPKEDDRNFVFHLYEINKKIPEQKDPLIYMLSSDYVMDYIDSLKEAAVS